MVAAITDITIPDNTTNIGDSTFNPCRNFTSIYCKKQIPPMISEQDTNFQYSSCKLYVPTGCTEAYKAADGWEKFKNIIETDFSELN